MSHPAICRKKLIVLQQSASFTFCPIDMMPFASRKSGMGVKAMSNQNGCIGVRENLWHHGEDSAGILSAEPAYSPGLLGISRVV